MSAVKLKLVGKEESERIYGSRSFISRTRNPALASPIRFQATRKSEGDVVISALKSTEGR